MRIEFSTTCIQNAKNYLSHESFNHFSEEQKAYILANLGRIRVLDPAMHSGGNLRFDSSATMLEFIKLFPVDTENYMFRHSYLNPNLELIKHGVSLGLKISSFSLKQVCKRGLQDILDYYIAENLVETIQVVDDLIYNDEMNFDFFVKNYSLLRNKRIQNPFRLIELFSAQELILLNDRKWITLNDIKYSCNEKYNEIMRIKRALRCR